MTKKDEIKKVLDDLDDLGGIITSSGDWDWWEDKKKYLINEILKICKPRKLRMGEIRRLSIPAVTLSQRVMVKKINKWIDEGKDVWENN